MSEMEKYIHKKAEEVFISSMNGKKQVDTQAILLFGMSRTLIGMNNINV